MKSRNSCCLGHTVVLVACCLMLVALHELFSWWVHPVVNTRVPTLLTSKFFWTFPWFSRTPGNVFRDLVLLNLSYMASFTLNQLQSIQRLSYPACTMYGVPYSSKFIVCVSEGKCQTQHCACSLIWTTRTKLSHFPVLHFPGPWKFRKNPWLSRGCENPVRQYPVYS